MRVSIRQVAERAEVSVGTVSRVLNVQEGARISKATQARVLAAAAELNYQPNPLARGLWRGKTDTIGLLVSGLRNPFFVELMEASQTAALEAGYQVLVDSGPSTKGTYNKHTSVKSWPVDAALAWTNPDQVITAFLGASGSLIVVVYLGYERSDGSDWVAFDLKTGIELVAEHLHKKNHQRVAFVSAYDEDKLSSEARYTTYCRMCLQYKWNKQLFATENEFETRQAGIDLAGKIAELSKDDRPTALICHNDILAIGILAGLQRAGIRVPEDIAVTGFDGIEEGQCLVKPLTTLRTDPEEMVRAALEIMYSRLKGTASTEPQHAFIRPILIEGGTT